MNLSLLIGLIAIAIYFGTKNLGKGYKVEKSRDILDKIFDLCYR